MATCVSGCGVCTECRAVCDWGEETSGNRWARGPDGTADGPIYPTGIFLFRLVISVNILGTQRAHNFLYHNFSVTSSWIVVLDTSWMMWFNSLIVMRRFAWISPSISWRSSSEIKDGLPLLCSSWTSVLPFGEFTAPLRHILPIHNVTINSNNLFVNFRWTLTFCFEKSYDGTHLAFGGTLGRRCHFKHFSLKQSRFYHCQRSTAHR